jgi:hypothetical protein
MHAEYVRKVIERLPFDVPVDGTHPSFPVLLYLFRLRDKNGEKSGGKRVKAFIKRPSRGASYTLYAVFEDGTEVDWSWRKALSLKNRRQDALNAFRYELIHSIFTERDKHTLGALVITEKGEIIPKNEVHIHHEENFLKILENFLREKGLRLEDIELEELKQGGHRLKDRKLADEWIHYHNTKARLKILSKQDHKKIHRDNEQKQ